jgi:hypothetical protein
MIPSPSTHSSCYQLICMRSGPCHRGLRCLDALAADQSRFARALPKRDRHGAVRKARAASAASGNGGFGSISSARPMTHGMSNIATSIPLKHRLVARVRDWPSSSFHRDAGAGVFPALIGTAISKRSVSLVSAGIGEANFTRGIAAWNGGLRLRPNTPELNRDAQTRKIAPRLGSPRALSWLGPFGPRQQKSRGCVGMSVWGECTKSLRSSPLRGGKSPERGSQPRGKRWRV